MLLNDTAGRLRGIHLHHCRPARRGTRPPGPGALALPAHWMERARAHWRQRLGWSQSGPVACCRLCVSVVFVCDCRHYTQFMALNLGGLCQLYQRLDANQELARLVRIPA